jgi:hypothetical protein
VRERVREREIAVEETSEYILCGLDEGGGTHLNEGGDGLLQHEARTLPVHTAIAVTYAPNNCTCCFASSMHFTTMCSFKRSYSFPPYISKQLT